MAETISNLERYFRQSTGINFLLRRKMIAAYPTDNAVATMRTLLAEAPETHLSVLSRQDLTVLIEDEDAQISSLQF